jgi:hypothetical protein
VLLGLVVRTLLACTRTGDYCAAATGTLLRIALLATTRVCATRLSVTVLSATSATAGTLASTVTATVTAAAFAVTTNTLALGVCTLRASAL